MVLDAFRGYVQLANGLTDVTRQRALQAARQLVDSGGDLLGTAVNSAGSADFSRQVQGLAEDLLATSRINRDLLVGLVRTEVERAVHRLGLVGADELNAMVRVVERLQAQLDAAAAFGGRGVGRAGRHEGAAGQASRTVRRDPVTFGGTTEPAGPRPAKKAAAGPATAEPAKKTTAKKAPAKKTAAKKTAAKKTAAKKTAAKKVPAKNVPAKKGAAKKAAVPTAQAPTAQAPAGPAPTDPGTTTAPQSGDQE